MSDAHRCELLPGRCAFQACGNVWVIDVQTGSALSVQTAASRRLAEHLLCNGSHGRGFCSRICCQLLCLQKAAGCQQLLHAPMQLTNKGWDEGLRPGDEPE